jgi:hypothetical protein
LTQEEGKVELQAVDAYFLSRKEIEKPPKGAIYDEVT